MNKAFQVSPELQTVIEQGEAEGIPLQDFQTKIRGKKKKEKKGSLSFLLWSFNILKRKTKPITGR